MILIAYGFAVLLFYAAFKKLNVIGRTRDLLATFRSAMSVMSDKDLTDLEKEKRIQAGAIAAIKGTLGLILSLIAVLAVAAVPVLVAIYAKMLLLDDFVAFSLDPLVLVGTVIALIVVEKLLKRLPG